MSAKKKKMLKESHSKAGLGNPSHFTTNSNENMNAVLKSKLNNYKKIELPEFLENIK